jgi:hypothetical protein
MTIHTKLLKAISKMEKIKKDSNNPFYKSKYYDINSLLETVKPILHEEGLVLLQPIENNCVVSRIYDVDTGDFVDSSMKIPDIDDPQKIGSCVSYFRRYTLSSLLSVEAEDDDANATVKKEEDDKDWLNKGTTMWTSAEKFVADGGDPEKIFKKYKVSKPNREHLKSLQK